MSEKYMQKDLRGTHLSFQQARLWALQGGSQAYRVQCALMVEGQLDRALFYQALQQVAHRHKILLTRLRILPGMETPVQIIGETIKLSCLTIDLKDLQTSEQTKLLDMYFAAMQEELFDLESGSTVHALLLCISVNNHVLLLGLPALYADATSLKLFAAEMQHTYTACLQGKSPEPDEEPLQYADVSAWQNELLREEADAEEERAFWRKIDLSCLASMHLPFARDVGRIPQDFRPSNSFAPQKLEFPLEPEVYNQIRDLAQRCKVSCEAFLLACWQVLLWRLTDESPSLLGVMCDGRPYEDLASLLGLYTRAVPLHISLDGNLSFEWVLTRIAESLREATEEQLYFTWEQASTSAGREQIFFPVSFEFESWPSYVPGERITISLIRRFCCTEPFVIKLSALLVGETLRLEAYYDPVYLEIRHIQHLMDALKVLLHGILAQPAASLASLPLLSPDQQQILWNTATGPQIPLPAMTLQQLFEAQVERTPQQLAIVCGSEQLTYQQFNQQANRLAHFLRRQGVGPNVLVGLCVERSVQMLVGLMAILKAGGAYVPLDPDQPPRRLLSLLNDTTPPLVLTQKQLQPRLATWEGQAFCLDSEEIVLAREPDTNPESLTGPQDLIYIIYTSGSTGVPKGVMIRHQSVSNYTHSLCELLASEPGLHFATVSTLAADLGNTAIFCALVSGGCLHILPYETITSGETFARYMKHHPIDVLKIVPSHLSALLNTGQGREILPRGYLVLGGEALTQSLLARLRAIGCSCCVINHYGPTETTIGSVVNVLGELESRADLELQENGKEVVPIGRPIANTEAYILDRYQQLTPVGITGELYIGGAGLATGYLHQPDLTQQRFVSHPFRKEDGSLVYQTGDLARYTEDGLIEFVGRADSQVKIRGFRVELGEIETALRRHMNVREAVVALREYAPGEKQLVAYVVVKRQPQPTSMEISSFLEDQLPAYMLPSAILFLKTLPLTLNGKIDRNALPAPQDCEGKKDVIYIAPHTPVEEMLVGIWEEVLKVKPIGVHTDFAELGGHSLIATQIVARVRLLLQVDIPLRMFFETPTVAGLAKRVEGLLSHKSKREIPPLVPMVRTQVLPLSFAQQRLWFMSQLEPVSTAYNVPNAVRLSGRLDVSALQRSLAELIQRHESLRTTFQEKGGQPMQVITDETSHLPLTDLRILHTEQREAEAQRLIEQEAWRPFDLASGPLLRTTLLRLSGDEHILLLTMHHIISDGWSMGLLIHELTVLYRSFYEGEPSPLPDLPIQYADYALWQKQWLQGEVLKEQVSYWTKQLQGATPLELPTDYPRPRVRRARGTGYSFHLPSDLSQELVTLSRREGVTLFMTLLAAFQVLLYRYSGVHDIVVGTDIANRSQLETEGLIGFFVNLLALRTNLSGKPLFCNVLHRVRNMVLEAYAHQDIPFEMVIENLRIERQANQVPLVNVLFVLQNVPRTNVELPDLRMLPFASDIRSTKFDLALFLSERLEGIRGIVNYSTDLFKEHTIAGMMGRFEVLLRYLVAQPEIPVDVVEIYTEEEKAQKEHKVQEMRQFKQKGLRAGKREAVDLSDFNTEFYKGSKL